MPSALMLAQAHPVAPRDMALFSSYGWMPSDFRDPSYGSSALAETRIQQSRDDITNSGLQGVIYLLCDNGPNVYTTPKSAMKIQTSL